MQELMRQRLQFLIEHGGMPRQPDPWASMRWTLALLFALDLLQLAVLVLL